MARPETKGFQKPVGRGNPKKKGMAFIRQTHDDALTCSCGWMKIHPREKVREDAADRHIAGKKHGGLGVRM